MGYGMYSEGMEGEAPTEEEFWADGFLYFPTKPCWPTVASFYVVASGNYSHGRHLNSAPNVQI
jgi:hypothetical protein